jgi:hypothetical protein
MPSSDSLLDIDALLRAADPERRSVPDPAADAERLSALRTAIDRQRTTRPAARSTGGRGTVALSAVGRARPRARRLVLVGAPAVGVAAAAVIAVAVAGTGTPAPQADRTVSGTVQVVPGDAASAPAFLARIATASLSVPVVVPGPHQFVYVKSEDAFTEPLREKTMDGPGRLRPVEQRQVWLPQDPAHPTGLIRDSHGTVTLHDSVDDPARYAALAALPTDPAQLLAHIHATTAGEAGGPDYAAFDWIGGLLRESIAPPEVAAALFRAAALIPGVQTVPDAVDAAGRHGVGIAYVQDGQRYEWIFDADSYAYLGERDYLVQDTTLGPAGMLTGLSAVLERGVTDRAGDLPDARHTVR